VPLTPEAKARQVIDAQLAAAGWVIQDRDAMNRDAGLGVAVREFMMTNGPCDYLLIVQGRACGVIEAKKDGATLAGFAEQAAAYGVNAPGFLATWGTPLRFDYEATSNEILFGDRGDPQRRSRRVFGFHQPATLLRWLQEGASFRARLAELPALDVAGLRACQVEAIGALEHSLQKGMPRAFVKVSAGGGEAGPGWDRGLGSAFSAVHRDAPAGLAAGMGRRVSAPSGAARHLPRKRVRIGGVDSPADD
jgi:type I restriction enzyme R subunit